MVAQTIAHLYEIERDDTLVAQAFATSSVESVNGAADVQWIHRMNRLTGTVVVGIEESEEGADDENVSELVDCHLWVLFSIEQGLCLVCCMTDTEKREQQGPAGQGFYV